jgi:pimeloyl-ACP methyl ester carboxylesterase
MPRPVVLIHGMWCTGASFDRIAAILRARGHECHAPTLPAHEAGRHHPDVGNKSLREYLSFLEDYVRDRRFREPPILLGHSMGGLLAQQLAARMNVFALVLLTPVPPAGINVLSPSGVAALSRPLGRWGWWRKPQKPTFGRAVASFFNGVPPEKHQALYAGLVEESGRVVFEAGFWFLDRSRASGVDASQVRCPVFVVSAGNDKLTPAISVRKVAALYPQAALRHYPDRGHWVLDDEDTDEMTADAANWLQAQEQRTAAARREP